MDKNTRRIKEIYKLTKQLKALLDKESDLYKKSIPNRKNILTILRDGKEVEVTEGDLFEEVRIAGADCQAGEILKKMYGSLFEAAEKREAKNKELHDYVLKEFGFNFHQMTIGNYMKITEALIDYKLNK